MKAESAVIELYENDFMRKLFRDISIDDDDAGMDSNDYSNDNSNDHNDHSKREEEVKEFNDMMQEIYLDAFTIAMGGIFTELILYLITGSFVLIEVEDEEGGGDESSDDSNNENIVQYFNYFLGGLLVAATIGFIFWMFNVFVSYIQMRRDRTLYVMFSELKNRSQIQNASSSSSSSSSLQVGQFTVDENCCIAGCIKFSYKSHKLSEHIVTFVVAFMGWACGWAYVSPMYEVGDSEVALQCAAIWTVVGMLLYYLRKKRLQKRWDSWKRKAKQERENAAKENGNQSKGIGNGNGIGIDSNHDVESKSMEKKEEEQYEQNGSNKRKVTDSLDAFEMKAMLHKKLYGIINWNFYFRKCYGLMVALPWEICFELAMDENIENFSHQLMVRFAVALVATVVLSYCGLQFVEIQSEVEHHSTSHAMAQLLKGNHMKLKHFGHH